MYRASAYKHTSVDDIVELINGFWGELLVASCHENV